MSNRAGNQYTDSAAAGSCSSSTEAHEDVPVSPPCRRTIARATARGGYPSRQGALASPEPDCWPGPSGLVPAAGLRRPLSRIAGRFLCSGIHVREFSSITPMQSQGNGWHRVRHDCRNRFIPDAICPAAQRGSSVPNAAQLAMELKSPTWWWRLCELAFPM
jgi:hypothetical protein